MQGMALISEVYIFLHPNFYYSYNFYRSYVDVIAANLKQKLNLIDRMVKQQDSMRQKQEDAQNQIDKLHPLSKLVVQRTKELQAEVCFPSLLKLNYYTFSKIFHNSSCFTS